MNETFRQRVQDELTSVSFDIAIDEDIDELNELLEKFVMETGYARRGIDSARTVDEAVAFHAPIASELPDVPALRNLFRHAGFDDIGLILGRGL
jgi:hypothetical protein